MPVTMLPVRGLGSVGVISDLNPYDLPPNALSAGVNIRFENGKITRGPVYRTVHEYTGHNPAFVFSTPPITTSYEGIVTVSADGATIKQVVGTTETDVSPSGVVGMVVDDPFTHTFLGATTYLNRNSHAPLMKRASDAKFSTLPHWPADTRCKALRSYKDFLVALNVTKGATQYRSMVKWSDMAQFGGYPPSWDETSTSGSAGENILNEMKDEILDGMSLRDSFIIYGTNEVWTMDYIGGNFMFRFRKLYDSVGVINQNCVVQIDGLHYVFDKNDIYVHDGATKKSIIHGKNKDFVFQSLKYKLRHRFFVTHSPTLNEIYFCYVADDRFTGFRGATTGCNRIAAYNYRLDCWSFYDAPNVTGACLASVSSAKSYNDIMDFSHAEHGGSYLANEDDKDLHTLFSGVADAELGLTKSRIYGLDPIIGGRLVRPYDLEANKPAFAERIGIDLDEIGADLTLYKALHAIYPQLGVRGDHSGVSFQFGASDVVDSEPLWGPVYTFDPRRDSKVDIREAGKYLCYRIYHEGLTDFTFSGFDMLLALRGRR